MMEQSVSNRPTTARLFIVAGMLLLFAGLIFGLTGALQYVIPGFLKQRFSFEIIRPLHVSSVVFWILFAATGAVFSYLQESTGKIIYSSLLARLQLYIFSLTVLAIMISYFAGKFGGREYWEFPPALAIPIATAWLLFIINFVRSLPGFKDQPVYVWMWLTGLVFFMFTFIESYLWVFPYFRNNVINDMTVQWKSYGSMVGSWNMLIYGSSIFLMEKISGNKKYSRAPIAFALYFTGLFNLMFNWGHHIYTLPTYSFVKHISYAVSMTELFILGRIILQWRSTLGTAQKHFHNRAYRFILAADIWIFLNLGLAILMSIPGINVYTHGTHVTVAHTMGATIGINSFLLMAMATDILQDSCIPFKQTNKWFNTGYLTANISLFIFWISLIAAGILRAKWQMSDVKVPFSVMMLQLRPYFVALLISGVTLTVGFFIILYPLLINQLRCIFRINVQKRETKNSLTEAVC